MRVRRFVISTHLKLWIVPAINNFKRVEIAIIVSRTNYGSASLMYVLIILKWGMLYVLDHFSLDNAQSFKTLLHSDFHSHAADLNVIFEKEFTDISLSIR